MVLQRSLLPKRLAEVVGVRVAARYLPAREEVGGDWYDVIELPAAASASRSETWSGTGSPPPR